MGAGRDAGGRAIRSSIEESALFKHPAADVVRAIRRANFSHDTKNTSKHIASTSPAFLTAGQLPRQKLLQGKRDVALETWRRIASQPRHFLQRQPPFDVAPGGKRNQGAKQETGC